MSEFASTLMVAAGGLCVAGAVTSKSLLGIATSSIMFFSMVDVALTGLVSPVIWSGVLLLIGMGLSISLRSASLCAEARSTPSLQRSVAVPQRRPTVWAHAATVHAGGELPPARPTSSAHLGASEVGRAALVPPGSVRKAFPFFPHLGRTAAICCAITYTIMALQVVEHGTHGADIAGSAGAHQHHGHSAELWFVHSVVSLGVAVIAVMLILCVLQGITHRSWAVVLECLGMATMISLMQFFH